MKSRRVFAGLLLLMWAVCGCGEASAWWFGGEGLFSPKTTTIPLPDGDSQTTTIEEALEEALSPRTEAVSTKTTTIPLPGGGTQTTTETVINPSGTGAMTGAAAGAALGAKIGTMIGGPAGTGIGAVVGGTIGGIIGWIFGPA